MRGSWKYHKKKVFEDEFQEPFSYLSIENN